MPSKMTITFAAPARQPATPRRREPVQLTPLDPAKTVKRPTFRRINRPDGPTRMETWGATSADGVWTYIREESPGTPWITIHNGTGLEVDLSSSLRAAREATATGWVFRRLEEEIARRDDLARARAAG